MCAVPFCDSRSHNEPDDGADAADAGGGDEGDDLVSFKCTHISRTDSLGCV